MIRCLLIFLFAVCAMHLLVVQGENMLANSHVCKEKTTH